MLYEDPTKSITSNERFHVELHFSPGVNCCVQKELVPGPGFNPQSKVSRKESVLEQPCCIESNLLETESVTPPPPSPFTASFKCNQEDLDDIFPNIVSDETSDLLQKPINNNINIVVSEDSTVIYFSKL